MTEADLAQRLMGAEEEIRALQEELAETNRGLAALTVELEQRVEERTTQLRAAQEELERTNLGLIQLTTELEDRVAERTAELEAKSEEVRAMSQQLWQAAKLATMGELAASIAHELNNPLATISLRIESLLMRTPADDPRHRALTVVEQEVERMATLVANLLQFSRASGSQVSTMDVREELLNTVELMQYHLRNRNITVVQEFASSVPLIHADRQRLRQLFLNLVTNASDAMSGGGTLTLRVAVRATGHERIVAPSPESQEATASRLGQVIVEIADTGSGIPPTVLPNVMEPFVTTKAEGKGTGLGLAICRRIIHEHHGLFEIESTVGEGTTVRVVLPRANGRVSGSTGAG